MYRDSVATECLNGAGTIVQNARHEFGPCPVGSLIFQINRFTRGSPTKRGDNQVKLGVTLKVCRLGIGYSAYAFEKSDSVYVPSPLPRSHTTRPTRPFVGKK